jgi:hypothetical protein
MMVILAGAALSPAARAQSIEDRIGAVRDGKVRMSFAARPGVYGNGRNSISFGDRGRSFESEDWTPDWRSGPVRVVLRMRRGEVTDVDTYVAGEWLPAGDETLDLGTVSAPRAAEYLLELARSAEGDAGKEAILPAALADSATVWPQLLRIARDGSLPSETRKSAVFWTGQAAGEAATSGLAEIVYDEAAGREVREVAIFALSQRPRDEGVPALIRIVRENRDPALVKKALFWLGQSGDPRALALFEEILEKGG